MSVTFGLGRMPSPILPASSKLDEQTALASILFVSPTRVPRRMRQIFEMVKIRRAA